MIIKITKLGKFANSFECESDGKKSYVSLGRFCKAKVEVGKTYDVKTYQKEGTKTVYLTEVKEITPVVPVVKVEPPKVKETLKDPHMSKEDWIKKDEGIKWLACIKASAEFNARRVDSSIDTVIQDAIKLFSADPRSSETEVTKVDQPQEALDF